MARRVGPADAVSGSPSYSGRAARQLDGVLVQNDSTTRPLGGRTGVSPGTPSSILGVSSSTWTVNPFGGVLDLEASAIAGPYKFAFDTQQSGSVNVANATNQRVDSLSVQLSDPAEGDATSAPDVNIIYTAGTPGAAGGNRGSAGGPPNVPARSMELAQIIVPAAGGGSPAILMMAPFTAAAGGVVVARSTSEYPVNPYDGQMAYNRNTDRLYAYDGVHWQPFTYTAKMRLARTSSAAINMTLNTDHPYQGAAWDAGSSGVVVSIGNDISYNGDGTFTVSNGGEYDWLAGIVYGSGSGVIETKVTVNGANMASGHDRRHLDAAHQTAVAVTGPLTLNNGDVVQFSANSLDVAGLASFPNYFELRRMA